MVCASGSNVCVSTMKARKFSTWLVTSVLWRGPSLVLSKKAHDSRNCAPSVVSKRVFMFVTAARKSLVMLAQESSGMISFTVTCMCAQYWSQSLQHEKIFEKKIVIVDRHPSSELSCWHEGSGIDWLQCSATPGFCVCPHNCYSWEI